MSRIEELLDAPYWVIDILPEQVPAGAPGQYFTIEDHLLKHRILKIKQKHIDLILKLNCYHAIEMEDVKNPAPEQIEAVMKDRYVYIMVGGAMILSEPDDTCMTIFNPDGPLLDLLKVLAASEGLFLWQPPQSPAGGS